MTLTGCTISGNSAVRDGGGLFAYGGTMTLTKCTVSDNSAALYGGGVDTEGRHGHTDQLHRQRQLRPVRAAAS